MFLTRGIVGQAVALSIGLVPALLIPAPATAQTTPPVVCSQPVCVLPATPLWNGEPPPLPHWPGSAPKTGPDETSPDGETVFNVTQPSVQAFLPATTQATGAAVLLVPGGGFHRLSIQNSGTRVAHWLAEQGIAAFVLRYRTFYRAPGESSDAVRQRVSATMGKGDAGAAALADGTEAMRHLRSHATTYGIDPQRLGVVGFSAGGHVAGMLALAADTRERANFVGLIYGMPLTTPALPPAHLPYPPGTPKEPWLRPAPTPAPGAMPPLFMAMAQDDMAVSSGFRGYYDALFAAGYRPELHLFQNGRHGFGMQQQGTTSDHWMQSFHWWIEAMGFKKPTAAP